MNKSDYNNNSNSAENENPYYLQNKLIFRLNIMPIGTNWAKIYHYVVMPIFFVYLVLLVTSFYMNGYLISKRGFIDIFLLLLTVCTFILAIRPKKTGYYSLLSLICVQGFWIFWRFPLYNWIYNFTSAFIIASIIGFISGYLWIYFNIKYFHRRRFIYFGEQFKVINSESQLKEKYSQLISIDTEKEQELENRINSVKRKGWLKFYIKYFVPFLIMLQSTNAVIVLLMDNDIIFFLCKLLLLALSITTLIYLKKPCKASFYLNIFQIILISIFANFIFISFNTFEAIIAFIYMILNLIYFISIRDFFYVTMQSNIK